MSSHQIFSSSRCSVFFTESPPRTTASPLLELSRGVPEAQNQLKQAMEVLTTLMP
ncbi:alpha/beta hydrolase [Sesbania bispinosa]|nr:alpha/beta hydrolase [Sesbania bispinosa]